VFVYLVILSLGNQMEKQYFCLVNQQVREKALQAIKTAPEGFLVEVKAKTRSLDQNARLWAMLKDVSHQVSWHGRKLSPTDWKHIFSSSLKKMDVVPNLEGNGFVILGLSTSNMNIKEMIDLQELISAFGVEHNVEWSSYE
jgi:hypothetical protein